ncbi:hypothetical protein RJ639_027335 [Escallonia herrerae]|uniref:Myb/SANT-like domain-containing protein n=1 Tax=Escallonia herrerae TaxID=1293975 RepID=A0AA88X7K1_9ASTE|nr:hypothetical protein RJ639_027335 [Escallonia herrerae]
MKPLKEINPHFKPTSFVRVAQAINQKFGCECSPLHVENHLRTVKKTWSKISLLRGRSGYGWDANLNMIVCDKQQYDEEVTNHLISFSGWRPFSPGLPTSQMIEFPENDAQHECVYMKELLSFAII